MNGSNSRNFSFSPSGEDIINDKISRRFLQEIKKELSNARIMTSGLENTQTHWVIGKKSYDPEKILVFLETIWLRLKFLMEEKEVVGKESEFERLTEMFWGISKEIKVLSKELMQGEETTKLAEQIFSDLKKAAAGFLNIYFRTKYYRQLDPKTFSLPFGK
jgi:hypothetical protein